MRLSNIFQLLLSILPLLLSTGASATEPDLATLRSALIPKREIAADTFLKTHPTWDGRGVVIGIFDSGVDPAAGGLVLTTTGQRKIIDIIDATGTGDVDTTTVSKADAGGTLRGLSGRKLTLPDGVQNPSGNYRLGLKPASELFYPDVLKRLTDRRAAAHAATASLRAAQRGRSAEAAPLKAALAKPAEERTRVERDLIARDAALMALDSGKSIEDAGALYDCVLWHDGSHWRVLVDTNEDGDLRDEKTLRPFGVAGEFASFGDLSFANFGVQVYEEGRVLSLVTVAGAHGTHVASIATAHFPEERGRDGIAPGARIVSVNVGDIRVGGSSIGISDPRAAAAFARHKVDIVNASWGGRTTYQDGRDTFAREFDRLVERYDILAVLSVGNEGPALGTAGTAGGEARRVLGVGAYLSPEMSRVLYNTLEQTPAGAMQFTSRGPTKDGAVGAGILAPGAAFASLSSEALRGSDMFNGTSMAAPSVSGVAALLLSAARANQLDAAPARLRAALTLGATLLPQETVLTGGAGLVNAPLAWKKLQDLQGQPAFAGFYDVEVNHGTFNQAARGLMLRETISERRRRFTVRVTPAWPESVRPATRVAFESDLLLKPSVPWLRAPPYAHLVNGPRTLSMIVDVPTMPAGAVGSLHTARVDALLARQPGLGPLFSVPVTVIQPAPATLFKDHRFETALSLKPALTQRHFVQAPANATRLRVWVRHRAQDGLVRNFNVHAVAYAAQTYLAAMETRRSLVLQPGAESSFDLTVRPGTVAEVAYTLSFTSVGNATLETRLEWLGAGLGSAPIVMQANAGWTGVEVVPYADREVKVEARLDRAVHSFLPERTQLLRQDERGEFPASPMTPGPVRLPLLRQNFLLDLKAPLTAHVLAVADHETSSAIGGGLLRLTHESGEVLFDSGGNSNFTRLAVTLPKGKSTGIREFVATETETLDLIKHLLLRLSEALKTPRPLPVFKDMRTRLNGKPVTDLRLKAGQEEQLMLHDNAVEDLLKHEPRPTHFAGAVVMRDTENREIARQVLTYLPGVAPSKVSNVEPKAKPPQDGRSELEKLTDSLHDSRLAFVREQRGSADTAVAKRRDETLTALRVERPADAALVFEQALDAAFAASLASDIWPKAKPGAAQPEQAAAVLKLLDEAHRLAQPEAVAQHLGTPAIAEPGDTAARTARERDNKRFTTQRETLARTERLRADVLRASGQWDPAWKAMADLRRWETAPGDKATRALEALMLEQAGHFGLALDALNARIKDEPGETKWLRQRQALYEKLGWSEAAANEALRLARMANQRRLVNAL